MRAALARAKRWLTPITAGAARSVVALFVLMVALSVANLLFTGQKVNDDNAHWHQAVSQDDAHWRQALAESQRKFCGVITGFTAVKVARPADPRSNPSRENQWEWYERFVKLGQDLGC